MMKEFIEWLIRKYMPGYHLSKNPTKGTKRTRKEGTKIEDTQSPS